MKDAEIKTLIGISKDNMTKSQIIERVLRIAINQRSIHENKVKIRSDLRNEIKAKYFNEPEYFKLDSVYRDQEGLNTLLNKLKSLDQEIDHINIKIRTLFYILDLSHDDNKKFMKHELIIDPQLIEI